MKKLFFILLLIQASSVFLYSQSLQWAKQYQNTLFGFNYLSSVAVDKSGNVFVTGQSDSVPNSTDFTTIKYNSAGVQQWIRRYDGPIHGSDNAVSIKVDTSGNIYVTGTSQGADTSNDFATVKYNSAGVQQWAVRYNGMPGGSDDAKDLVIDNSGNVYVTGQSDGGATTLTDIATIKYNSSGVQQWVARYNGGDEDFAPFIRVSNSGNVYVTGVTVDTAANNQNYITLKYNSSGVQQWAKTYNGTANGDDNPSAFEIDASENVYVTGSASLYNFDDFATLKYNSSGTLQWTAIYSDSSDYPRGLAVDNSGNVYVTGSTIYYATFRDTSKTIKYNSAGVQQWIKKYSNSTGSWDPVTIKTDLSGNVYILSQAWETLTGSDFSVMKCNSSGAQQWIANYNSSGTSGDSPQEMVLDSSGNIFICGNTYENTNGYTFMTTVKFSQSGAALSSLSLTAFIEGLYNSSTNVMVSDTVAVILRSTIPPYNKVDSVKGKLNSSGAGTFNFTNAVNGTSYYITVKHRNAVETWSNTGNSFSAGALTYNFSSAANKAYGNNQIQTDSSPLRFGFYSGDVNQDGFVDLTDIVLVFNDASIFVTGYVKSDINGDNITDLTDLIFVFNNSSNFVKKITPP